MKRFSLVVALSVLACGLAGCDGGGIPEGMPNDGQNDVMPSQLKAEMEKNANKMIMKKPAKSTAKAGGP
jgi:hypothetical protein